MREVKDFAAEDIKERKKWQGLMVRKVFHYPMACYVVLCIYFLQVDMSDWIFNISQFNSLILSLFPKAEYWSNISVVYREKMIVQYVIFHFFQGYILLASLVVIVKNWARFNVRYVPADIRVCTERYKKYTGLVVIAICLVLVVFGDLNQGSVELLALDQLDNTAPQRLFTDESKWNSLHGFLITKGVLVALPGMCVFLGSLIISSILYCNKT